MEETKIKRKVTTIALENEVLDSLKKLKIHPNQSYSELIKTILEKQNG